jgi:hypothetical protein
MRQKNGPASPLKPGLTSSIVKRLGIIKNEDEKEGYLRQYYIAISV